MNSFDAFMQSIGPIMRLNDALLNSRTSSPRSKIKGGVHFTSLFVSLISNWPHSQDSE